MEKDKGKVRGKSMLTGAIGVDLNIAESLIEVFQMVSDNLVEKFKSLMSRHCFVGLH